MSRLRRKTSKLATASAPRQQTENPQPLAVPNKAPNRKKFVRLTLWPLVAATFFMVSGGAYGTEDIVHGAGYGRGILILLLTPLLWSLPTAFMIGELSSALPFEGGYYAWVRRGMGNFWGFQEAWLSLVASIFDMAIYPTLFVAYLDASSLGFSVSNRAMMVGLAVIAVSATWNILGVRAFGVYFLLAVPAALRPFARSCCLAPLKFRRPFRRGDLARHFYHRHGGRNPDLHVELHGMGQRFDNRHRSARPQRTYPRAMLLSVCIVAASYILPFSAMWLTGRSHLPSRQAPGPISPACWAGHCFGWRSCSAG